MYSRRCGRLREAIRPSRIHSERDGTDKTAVRRGRLLQRPAFPTGKVRVRRQMSSDRLPVQDGPTESPSIRRGGVSGRGDRGQRKPVRREGGTSGPMPGGRTRAPGPRHVDGLPGGASGATTTARV